MRNEKFTSSGYDNDNLFTELCLSLGRYHTSHNVIVLEFKKSETKQNSFTGLGSVRVLLGFVCDIKCVSSFAE